MEKVVHLLKMQIKECYDQTGCFPGLDDVREFLESEEASDMLDGIHVTLEGVLMYLLGYIKFTEVER